MKEMRIAPLGKYLTFPYALQIRAQSSFLVPFLYQTRTLLELQTTRRLYAFDSSVDRHIGRRQKVRRTPRPTTERQTYTERVRRTSDPIPREPAYNEEVRRLLNDPIAFVDHHYSKIPDTLPHTEPQSQKQSSWSSTVTASEQAAFEKLFRDVSPVTVMEPEPEEDILDQDEPDAEYDPNVDLNSIFEDAIRTLREEEENATSNFSFAAMRQEPAMNFLEMDRDGLLNATSRTIERPIKFANGTTFELAVETEEERARLEVASDDHRTLVLGMFDNANSDLEIWQVLEKEVFILITHLDEHIKVVERAKKEQALLAAKVRKAEAENKDVADVKLEKGDLTKEELSSEKLTHTNAIPLDNLLSILNRNYGEYCLHALRLFRRKYPTSFYAPSVLSTIKQRGPISYVLGVSTDIYNETLFLKWTQYSDLQGMADMMEEMHNQGIESNEVTVALIKGIAKRRWMGRQEWMGPVVKEWWAMRATVDGWRRVCNLYARILRENGK